MKIEIDARTREEMAAACMRDPEVAATLRGVVRATDPDAKDGVLVIDQAHFEPAPGADV